MSSECIKPQEVLQQMALLGTLLGAICWLKQLHEVVKKLGDDAVVQLFCNRCGRGSPLAAAACECSFEHYIVKLDFISQLYADRTRLCVFAKDDWGEDMCWYYANAETAEITQMRLPANVYPIPSRVVGTQITELIFSI